MITIFLLSMAFSNESYYKVFVDCKIQLGLCAEIKKELIFRGHYELNQRYIELKFTDFSTKKNKNSNSGRGQILK